MANYWGFKKNLPICENLGRNKKRAIVEAKKKGLDMVLYVPANHDNKENKWVWERKQN